MLLTGLYPLPQRAKDREKRQKPRQEGQGSRPSWTDTEAVRRGPPQSMDLIRWPTRVGVGAEMGAEKQVCCLMIPEPRHTESCLPADESHSALVLL